MVRRLIGTLFALFLLAGLARAEGEEDEGIPRSALDEAIVVTAARFEKDIRDTGATISVVDEADIQDRQVREVNEAISIVPGAYVSRGGPPGSSSSLFLRGAASNQVLVLLDGMPLNDPTLGGQFNFYDLGTDNLELIEVLRGSASTLYGSEAIGGVVHLRTRRGEGDPSIRFGVEAGSYQSVRALISGQGRVGDVDFSASISRRGVENELDNNRFESLTASGLFGWEIAPGFGAVLSGRYIESAAEDPWAYPFSEQIEEDENITRERRTVAGGLTLRHEVTEEIRWSLAGSLTDIRSDLDDLGDDPGDPAELVSRSDAQVGNISGIGEWRRPEVMRDVGLALLGGLEYQVEHSENRSETPFGASDPIDRTVRNTAGFLLAELAFWERLVASGGLRHDDNSAWGSVTTMSGSLLYHLVESDTRFRANYGEGFRGPKPGELDDPFVGNADLSPESSVSIDFGVEQSFFDRALVLEVTAFQLTTEDLIAYDPSTFLLQNYEETRTRGVETALSWWATKELLARTWWTFQDPEDMNAEPGEEDQLPGRPKWFGGADVSWRAETWSAGVHFQASGDYPGTRRITPDGDVREHPGQKILLGLRGRVELSENAALTARLENLLDDDWYDDTARPSGTGRAFYLGAEIEF